MTNTVLIVGSAPCLYSDLERALTLRPFASLFLLNGASTCVERAENVVVGHVEKTNDFARERRRVFPNAPPCQLHSICDPRRVAEYRARYPSVDQWHAPERGITSGSLSLAIRIAFALGFKEAVLAGCPLDSSGYARDEARVVHAPSCLRLGLPENQSARIVRGYRENFAQLAAGEFKGRCWSMSGFTRACLGEPT